MASSYSTDLKLELMVTGENAGQWGDKTNTNLNLVQQAVAGFEQITITDQATTTLVMSNAALSNARNMVLKIASVTLNGATILALPDGIEKFYIGHGASSSLIHGKTRGNLDFDNPIEVDCIDLSKWITENFDKDDYIILKMDVEGAEYKVLEKMINENTINYVNKLYVEFHGMRVFKTKEDTKKLRTEIRGRGIPVHNWDATAKKPILGIL